MRQLKDINYRDGSLRFRLPYEWHEEYGEQSGGTFFENAPDAGTLRLSVLVFNTHGKTDTDQLDKFLQSRSEAKSKGAEIRREQNGNVVLQFIQRTQENGDDMSIVWWFVASNKFENLVQIAVFSYSVIKQNLEKEQNQEDIMFLDQELRNTEFLKVPVISK